MDILNARTLQSNKHLKVDFSGGELSSDAGLLLLKEFAARSLTASIAEIHGNTAFYVYFDEETA